MFSLPTKIRFSAFLALLSLATISSPLMAWECCESSECNRIYVGAFGGGLFSNSTKISQMGTAFFLEAQGGPLAVFAQGHTKETSSGFGGLHIGYEWSTCPQYIGCTDWAMTPAVELEGYWYSHTKKGHLINPTLEEHDFLDTFHMNAGVYLANVVFSLKNCCCGSFTPYVGGGIGATRIYINGATSEQTSPPEVGVNHFNSRQSDSTWAFAAQVKTGLRYQICRSLHLFGEYRYLFVDASNYIFGSTIFPGHAPTSPWNVKVANLQYNACVFGIQYDL